MFETVELIGTLTGDDSKDGEDVEVPLVPVELPVAVCTEVFLLVLESNEAADVDVMETWTVLVTLPVTVDRTVNVIV